MFWIATKDETPQNKHEITNRSLAMKRRSLCAPSWDDSPFYRYEFGRYSLAKLASSCCNVIDRMSDYDAIQSGPWFARRDGGAGNELGMVYGMDSFLGPLFGSWP